MGLVAAWGFPALADVTSMAQDPARLATVGALLEPAARRRRLLTRVSELASTAVGAAAGYVTLVSEEHTHVVGSSVSARLSVIPLALSPCGQVIAAGGPLAIADLQRDPVGRDMAPARAGMLAFAAAPIHVHGHPVGTVAVADRRVRLFRPDELQLLDDLAATAALHLGRFANPPGA